MKRKIFISVALLLGLTEAASAYSIEEGYDGYAIAPGQDTPAEGSMTLEDCLDYAREHAHINIINRLEVEKAETDKRLAVSDMMPYISLSGDGNLSFGRNIDPETNTYDNKKTLSTGFGLRMSLPVFDGLVRINNYKASKAAKQRTAKKGEADSEELSIEIVRAFYNVSYCRAMVEQMREQLRRDSTDLAATERGEELGTRSGADVAELKAIVAADEYELSNQSNLLKKAYLTLRGKMGMPLTDSPLDLVESDDDPEISVSKDVHPRVAEAELALKESRYNLRAAKGAYSPSLSLGAGISTSYFKMMGSGIMAPGFSKQWHDNMGQYISVSLNIPLFTGLSTFNRVRKARIEVEESRTRLEQTRYDLKREQEEARLDLKNATEELRSAHKRLDAEEVAYNAVRRRYELGSASAIDLYTSSVKLATAKANLEGKRIQQIVNRIILKWIQR